MLKNKKPVEVLTFGIFKGTPTLVYNWEDTLVIRDKLTKSLNVEYGTVYRRVNEPVYISDIEDTTANKLKLINQYISYITSQVGLVKISRIDGTILSGETYLDEDLGDVLIAGVFVCNIYSDVLDISLIELYSKLTEFVLLTPSPFQFKE